MPVEDPRADAKVYLAKHNVEKIFEVRRPRPVAARAFARRAALPLAPPRPAGAS